MKECLKCLLTYDDDITVCPTCGSQTVIIPEGWSDIREPDSAVPEIYRSDISGVDTGESDNMAYSGSSFDMYDPALGSMRFRPANVGRIRYVEAPERRRSVRVETRRQRVERQRQNMIAPDGENVDTENAAASAQSENPRTTRLNNLRNNLGGENVGGDIGGFTPRQNDRGATDREDRTAAAIPRRPRRNGHRLTTPFVLINSAQVILPIIVLIAALVFVIANRAVIGHVLMIFTAAWAVLFVLMLLLLRRSIMRDSIVTLTTIGAIIATLVIYNVGGIGSTIGVFVNAIMPAVIIVFTLYMLIRSLIHFD